MDEENETVIRDENQIEAPLITITFDDETKRLLDIRKRQKSKKPTFLQTDSHKKKKLADRWKRPDGIHNKMRYSIKGKCPLVQPGYGSPASVRGLHPSGYEEVIVNNPEDIESLNASRQAARIAHTVGLRKRMIIENRAKELGLKVLNPARGEE